MGRFLCVLGLAFAVATSASAAPSHRVKGYVKSNGTYVAPARATNPNGTTRDNWSTKPNVNPYTGKPGAKTPSTTYKPYKAPKP